MKGVIFDFNGTLFPDTDKHRKAWTEFLARRGMILEEDDYKAHFLGPTNRQILEMVFKRKLSDDELARYAFEKEDLYRSFCRAERASLVLTGGAEELLDALTSSGIPIAVATGSDPDNVDFYYEALGIGKWIPRELMIYNDGTIPSKPAPDFYLRAASAISLPPEECVVFEDGDSGFLAAHAAGAGKIIGIIGSNTKEKILSFPGVCAAVADFREAKDLLAEDFPALRR